MTTTQGHTHTHRDGHEHGHDHTHAPEQMPGPSEAGTVMLDIGPGVGAAVVLTRPDMLNLEIEYRAAGDEWQEKHMAVRERHGAATVQYAAIFGPLPEGDYEFRVRGGSSADPALVMAVTGASVASAWWPA